MSLKFLSKTSLLITASSMLMGCSDEDKVACVVDDMDAVATAMVDGSPWAANGGMWAYAGSAMQVSLESAVSLTLGIRGTIDAAGEPVAELMESGAFPIVVDLGDSDGHGGVTDLRNGIDAYASTQPGGSGSLTIAGLNDGVLTACFEYVAANDEGVVMEVRDGKVRIGD